MIKVRASQIVIETPREGAEPWIHVVVQRVEKLPGGVVNTADRWDTFSKRLQDVAAEQYPVMIDLSSGTFSPADVATHLGFVIKMWLAARYNGTLDPATGDVVVG